MAINDVSLTSGMRANLLSLQGTVDLLDRTQSRLSSGKKVNTAIDNPISFFASQSLTSRASTIDSLKDAMGQAVQTITAADKGIKAITAMIEQAKGIAQSALSAEAGTGFATGSVTMEGVAPAQSLVQTGHITLTGIDAGTDAPDTGTITLAAGFTEGDSVTIDGVTFTATLGAAGAGEFQITDDMGLNAGALRDAINVAFAGAINFTATSDAGVVSLSKTVGGNAVDVVVGDITLDVGAGATATAIIAGAENVGADTIVLGGVTFTAVTANADATQGEFIASGNDAVDMASLAQAINNVTYAGYTGGRDFTAEMVDGALTISKTVAGVATSVAGADFALGTAGAGEASLTVDALPDADEITIGGVVFTATAGAQVDGDRTFTATGNDASDMANLAAAINSADWTGAVNTFEASVNNGILRLTKTVTATGAGADVIAGDFAFAVGTDNDGTAAQEVIAAAPGELADLVAQFNTMRTQIDELAEDSGYKGKNLLSATEGLRSMAVKFEGTTLNVAGFDATTGANGLNVTSADAGATKWTDGTASIDASIEQLDAALNTMRQNSSALAGNLSIITVRQDFSTNMINTLTAGADKLTLADSNEEGANMLMLQTRQTLSTTALSMSAQAAQSVLRLFQ
ncbi:MAG: hypothetical protein LLG97_11845 [Deltaproteobacteria bacterium]|nr:hypothetical protein [Deltaproteobacteria bacterium]